MCGIFGEIRFDNQVVESNTIGKMNALMQARGPDDESIYVSGNRGFGHRRLKIMDLSAQSQQPMIDNHLGLGIVFNGTIYNHPELREELKQKGYTFFQW